MCDITFATPVKIKDCTKTRFLEEDLVEKIRLGIPVTSEGNREKTNTLTRLRRRGVIRNQGTRKNPKWVLVESKPTESIYDIPSLKEV